MPKVCMVDEFAGQERKVVVISTTHSRLPEGDCDGLANHSDQEGFLGAPDRSNVALSRARYHVCIIGNHDTLSKVGFVHVCYLATESLCWLSFMLLNGVGHCYFYAQEGALGEACLILRFFECHF